MAQVLACDIVARNLQVTKNSHFGTELIVRSEPNALGQIVRCQN